MSEATQLALTPALDEMKAAVTAVPSDARRDKALYHLERLRLALAASHQEAVRFAAFTLNKTVHDASADWGEAPTAAMATLAAALQAAGHHF
jgi:hypothetical protein